MSEEFRPFAIRIQFEVYREGTSEILDEFFERLREEGRISETEVFFAVDDPSLATIVDVPTGRTPSDIRDDGAAGRN